MVSGEKLWSIRDLAEYLHVHIDTIRARIQSRTIKAINVGTQQRAIWVVAQSDLDAYLNATTNDSFGRVPRRRSQGTAALDALLSK